MRKGSKDYFDWFEKILDAPINPRFYDFGAFMYAKRNTDGALIRSKKVPYKLSYRKIISSPVLKYNNAVEDGRDQPLFHKTTIPQAAWDKMTILETLTNKKLIYCHLLCEKNEECNLFRWEDETCTLAYVSKHILIFQASKSICRPLVFTNVYYY